MLNTVFTYQLGLRYIHSVCASQSFVRALSQFVTVINEAPN